MTIYNFSLTGTKTTGPSTIDDWTDANCYPQTFIHAVVEADGDVYNFNENLAGLGTTTYIPSFEFSINKGITINTRYGANGGGAILERASGGTLMSLNPDSAAVMTVNDLKLSGANVSSLMLNLPSSLVAKNIVLNRTEFIAAGAATMAIGFSQENGSVTLNDVVISGIFTASIIFGAATMGTTSAMDVVVDGLHFDDVIGQSAGGFYGLLLRKGNNANAVSVTVRNVTGKITATNVSGAVRAVEVQGANSLLIETCTHTVEGIATGTAAYGIIANGLDATVRQTVDPIIRNNDVKFNCPAGDGISVGTDTTVGFMLNPLVHDNNLTGLLSAAQVGAGASPHGLTFRGLPSGKGFKNIIRGFHSPLMLSLCTSDDVQLYGNLIADVYGVILSLKGNSGGQMHNNLGIATPNSMDGTVTKPYGIWAREQGATANSASKTYNNSIIYLGMTKTGMFTLVDALDANTFSNDNYYTDQVLPVDAWGYTGVTYATLALWNAAQETNDATDKKNFSATVEEIIAAFGDLDIDKLVATPETYGGGLKWWTGANPDTLGGPLSDIDTDQGIQSTSSPLHPTRL